MGLRVFYGFDELPYFRRPVVTIGTFDGVHRGHRQILARTIERAQQIGGESVAITFDRHPRGEVQLLTSLDEKIALIDALGIDNLIVAPFSEEFRQLTAREFTSRYLVGKIGIEELVVGFNHRLGSDRNSDFEALGLKVERVAQHGDASSSRIRQLLKEGRVEEAEEMLGRKKTEFGVRNSEVETK